MAAPELFAVAALPVLAFLAGPWLSVVAALRIASFGFVVMGFVDLGSVDLGSVDLGAVDLGAVDLGAVDLGAVDLGFAGLVFIALARPAASIAMRLKRTSSASSSKATSGMRQ